MHANVLSAAFARATFVFSMFQAASLMQCNNYAATKADP